MGLIFVILYRCNKAAKTERFFEKAKKADNDNGIDNGIDNGNGNDNDIDNEKGTERIIPSVPCR